jgi:hypothetical protein
MVPREQRALLRIERSLRKDPSVRAMLETFTRRCYRGQGPTQERLSPWHPVLWSAVFVMLAALTVTFIALSFVTVICMG